jgi:hypothetical protein
MRVSFPVLPGASPVTLTRGTTLDLPPSLTRGRVRCRRPRVE